MDCSDVFKQGTKQLGVGVDAAAFLESTLDEISSICSNEAGKSPFFCLRCRAQRTEIACFAAELMKKGQQQEPLQDHIERLEDEINDAIHKVEENTLFAPGCVRRAQPYRAHLGHKWAAKCVLEHILSHTGELQEELNRMYDEAFTDFMTDFVAQVGALFFV